MGLFACCVIYRRRDVKPVWDIEMNRKCTDWCMLIVYGLLWLYTIAAVVMAMGDGASPMRILHGSDMSGVTCGSGVNEDKPYKAWPVPDSSFVSSPDPSYFTVCVEKCEHTTTDPDRVFAVAHKSTEVMYSCVPEDSSMGSLESSMHYAVADLAAVAMVVFSCFFVACALSFVYLQLVKKCAAPLVYFCIFMTVISGLIATVVCWKIAVDAQPWEYKKPVTGLKCFSVFCGVGTLIFICVCFFLRKRILLALKVLEVSAQVFSDLWQLVLLPLGMAMAALAYLSIWVWVAVTLFSVPVVHKLVDVPAEVLANNNTNPTTATLYSPSDAYEGTMWLHFFALFWNTSFLIYIAFMIVAGVSCEWYFSKYDENDKKIRGPGKSELSETAIMDSVKRVLRYHLGSIALASLIITVFRMIKNVLEYLQKKTKNSQGRPNCLQRSIWCCITKAFKSVEKCIDSVNKNALVWQSIYGSSFCMSAGDAFQLIWRNLIRTCVLDGISDWLLTLGQFMVASFTAVIYLVIFWSSTNISPLLPCLVIFVMAYLVAGVFMVIYETIIDTIFLCFLVDCEVNAGREMAPKPLKELVERNRGASESAYKLRREYYETRYEIRQIKAQGRAVGAPGFN